MNIYYITTTMTRRDCPEGAAYHKYYVAASDVAGALALLQPRIDHVARTNEAQGWNPPTINSINLASGDGVICVG